MTAAVDAALARTRKICLALPGAQERDSHGFPTFFVGKRVFVYFLYNHHGDGKLALNVKSDHAGQDMLVRGDPERFFVPAYVGHQGWVGVRLEGKAPWGQIEDLVQRGWRMVAPKKLLKGDAPAASTRAGVRKKRTV